MNSCMKPIALDSVIDVPNKIGKSLDPGADAAQLVVSVESTWGASWNNNVISTSHFST